MKAYFDKFYYFFTILTFLLGIILIALISFSGDRQGLPFRIFVAYAYFLPFVVFPLSALYLYNRYKENFLKWWEHPIGKLVYGLITVVILLISKIEADVFIRDVLQTNPNQFSNAQNAISIYSTLSLSLSLIFLLMIMITIVNTIKIMIKALIINKKFLYKLYIYLGLPEIDSNGIGWRYFMLNFFPFIIIVFYLPLLIVELDNIFGMKDVEGNSINIREEIIILSSFSKNEKIIGHHIDDQGNRISIMKTFCKNVSSRDYIATSSSDLIPNQVIVASYNQDKRKIIGYRGRFNFRLSYCENSNDPNHIREIPDSAVP